MTPQFDPSQQAEALALVESCPWGDTDYSICDMEAALRLAMEATSADYVRWENEVAPTLEDSGYDEFSVLAPSSRRCRTRRSLPTLPGCSERSPSPTA